MQARSSNHAAGKNVSFALLQNQVQVLQKLHEQRNV